MKPCLTFHIQCLRVATALDILSGPDYSFLPLPHSHLGLRNCHLSHGPCSFPFTPIGCSQHRRPSESPLVTSPALAPNLAHSKTQQHGPGSVCPVWPVSTSPELLPLPASHSAPVALVYHVLRMSCSQHRATKLPIRSPSQ